MIPSDPNHIASTEFGLVRLFSTELDPETDAAITAQNVHKLFGSDVELNADKVEVFPSKAIADLGLRQYLIDGYGIAEADLTGKAAALDALSGLIILVPTSAFMGMEQHLDPNPSLRFIGTFREEAAAPAIPMSPTASAEGAIAPPFEPVALPAGRGHSWLIALGALLIAAALVLFAVL